LAGLAHPGKRYQGRDIAEVTGKSLVAWLNGDVEVVHAPGTTTGWELFGRRAIREDDWKAVYVPDAEGSSQWQLYDLGRDRGEVHDLAETHPEKLAQLLALWERYREENGVLAETPPSILDADPAAVENGWPSYPAP
jgi:arylsulfatase A-like enzyme